MGSSGVEWGGMGLKPGEGGVACGAGRLIAVIADIARNRRNQIKRLNGMESKLGVMSSRKEGEK